MALDVLLKSVRRLRKAIAALEDTPPVSGDVLAADGTVIVAADGTDIQGAD